MLNLKSAESWSRKVLNVFLGLVPTGSRETSKYPEVVTLTFGWLASVHKCGIVVAVIEYAGPWLRRH